MPTKPENLQWIDISDFSAGITATPGSGITPADPGAASNAYMCMPGPSGGLIPAPRLTRTYTTSAAIANITVGNRDPNFPYAAVLDFMPWGLPSTTTANWQLLEGTDNDAFPIEDEIHLLTQHYDLNGGNQRRITGIRAHRLDEITGSATIQPSNAGTGSPYQETYTAPSAGAMTFNAANRYYGPGNLAAVHTTTPTFIPGIGFLACARTGGESPTRTDGTGQVNQAWSWGARSIREPGWAWLTQTNYAPTTGPYSWTASTGSTTLDAQLSVRLTPAFVAGHQGRGIMATYGAGVEPGMLGGGVTDPGDFNSMVALVPTSIRFSTPGGVHNPQNWTGWFDITEPIGGIAGLQTLSSDDMLVLGNTGGAVRIRGDLGTSPQLTRMPMLPSGLGRATAIVPTPEGLVWGTRNGVWLWSGGDTAELLSPQLPYDFWWDPIMDYWGYLQQKGRPVCSYPYLFFPNGWVCDLRFKSWFRFGERNAAGHYPAHYGMSANGDVLASYPTANIDNTTTPLIQRYDPSEYHDEWTWTSQPFEVSRSRVISFREISVSVLNPTSTNQFTLILDGRDETNAPVSWTKTVTVDTSPYPQLMRFEMSLEVAECILTMQTDSSGGRALAVHRVGVGYNSDRSVARR